jgi:hypothetical protein
MLDEIPGRADRLPFAIISVAEIGGFPYGIAFLDTFRILRIDLLRGPAPYAFVDCQLRRW